MPIAINGSGTVTGISVGGLPDGIVDADMLAANAVTAAKLASGVGGKLGQIVTQVYEPGGSSVSTSSTSFVDTGMTLSITPSNTNSKIFIFGIANGHRCTNTDANAIINIKRAVSGGSTDNLSGQNLGIAHTYSTNAQTSPIFFVDGTTGTAQRTYTVVHRCTSGSRESHIFRANTSNMFVLMEILP